jgi:hypothetical protein
MGICCGRKKDKKIMATNDSNIFGFVLAIFYVLLLMGSAVLLPIILAWFTDTGVSGGIAFFFLLILLFAIQTLKIGYDSTSWPSVEGVITESFLDGTRNNNTSPRVVYQYMLNDKSFTNNVIKTGRSVNIRTEAEKVITTYPIKKKVIVYYNPLKPKYATLETGIDNSSLIVPIVLLLAAIVAAFFALKNWPGIHPERFSEFINSLKQYLTSRK